MRNGFRKKEKRLINNVYAYADRGINHVGLRTGPRYIFRYDDSRFLLLLLIINIKL